MKVSGMVFKIIVVMGLFFCGLASADNSIQINFYKGWNLISMQESNLSKLDSAIKIVWGYKNKKWYAYTDNPVVQAKIKDANISQLTSLNSNEGVWIFVDKDTNITINTHYIGNYTLVKGWNLLGTTKPISPSLFGSCTSYIWGYDSSHKQWKLYRNDGVDNYFSYEKLTKIEANSGFWVYAHSDANVSSDIANSKKLLIPLYSYPGKENKDWDKLIKLKKKYPSVAIVAIVNQSNGDFTKKSDDYIKGIKSLSDAGIQVIGYVYTQRGSRAITDVKANIDAWVKFYKPYGLKGFFFDEVASRYYEQTKNKSYFPYYKKISEYARSKGCKTIVLNPGSVVNDDYMNSGIASAVVIRETTYKRVNKNTESFNKPTATTKLGLLIHSSSEKNILSDVYNFATKYQFDYIYATDHGEDGMLNDDRWDKLSSYLDALMDRIDLFETFNVGFDGDYSFNSIEEGKKIWMSSVDLAMDDNISNNSSYQNIKDFNPSAFNNLHNYLKNSKFLVYWITKGWKENWYDTDKIQKAMDAGYIPVFIYWWFGDKLKNGIPDTNVKDAYAKDNLKMAKFLDKLHGTKILIMEPEFNKNDILADETTQHQFATIIGDAIDTIKANANNVLFSLTMTDTGNRGVNRTYTKCGYKNCGLGDKYEWGRAGIIYNDLLPKLDFISFQEVVGQFSRNPANPGGWNSPNPIAYSDADTGINESAQRIANFTQFLHDKYHKPVFLPYIGIATATWKDTNNNGIIEDSEINKSGWEKEAKDFYIKLSSMKQTLLSKGLFGFAPMALFDEPQHDYSGYQFFMNNEYHLGIIKSSAIDQVDIAANGDIQSKDGIVEIIFSDQNKSN